MLRAGRFHALAKRERMESLAIASTGAAEDFNPQESGWRILQGETR